MNDRLGTMTAALQLINDWACYASEEDTSAAPVALQRIGQAAREALADHGDHAPAADLSQAWIRKPGQPAQTLQSYLWERGHYVMQQGRPAAQADAAPGPKAGAPAAQAMASYTLSIDADTGYRSTTEGRCSAEQYSQVMAVLHGVHTPGAQRDEQAA